MTVTTGTLGVREMLNLLQAQTLVGSQVAKPGASMLVSPLNHGAVFTHPRLVTEVRMSHHPLRWWNSPRVIWNLPLVSESMGQRKENSKVTMGVTGTEKRACPEENRASVGVGELGGIRRCLTQGDPSLVEKGCGGMIWGVPTLACKWLRAMSPVFSYLLTAIKILSLLRIICTTTVFLTAQIYILEINIDVFKEETLNRWCKVKVSQEWKPKNKIVKIETLLNSGHWPTVIPAYERFRGLPS